MGETGTKAEVWCKVTKYEGEGTAESAVRHHRHFPIGGAKEVLATLLHQKKTADDAVDFLETYYDTPDFGLMKAGLWLRSRTAFDDQRGPGIYEWTLKKAEVKNKTIAYIEYNNPGAIAKQLDWSPANEKEGTIREPNMGAMIVNRHLCRVASIGVLRYHLTQGVFLDVATMNPVVDSRLKMVGPDHGNKPSYLYCVGCFSSSTPDVAARAAEFMEATTTLFAAMSGAGNDHANACVRSKVLEYLRIFYPAVAFPTMNMPYDPSDALCAEDISGIDAAMAKDPTSWAMLSYYCDLDDES